MRFFQLFLSHIEFTRVNNVKVVLVDDRLVIFHMTPVLANATYLTQPLDVAAFRLVEKSVLVPMMYSKKAISKPTKQIEKRNKSKYSKKKFKSGITKTGLHPVNTDEFLKRTLGEVEAADVERVLDNSLIDLLKEHRRKKRGKKSTLELIRFALLEILKFLKIFQMFLRNRQLQLTNRSSLHLVFCQVHGNTLPGRARRKESSNVRSAGIIEQNIEAQWNGFNEWI